jgi:hypothetical protein
MGSVDGSVLLIVNSAADRAGVVTDLFRELGSRAAEVHVIAPPAWREWTAANKLPAERVRYAIDAAGAEIELNHFLETPAAIEWVGDGRFRLIVGSEPHSLYNEEVKAIFEQRVALVLGGGCFLTHALPERGVYVFDRAGLVKRFGRSVKEAMYRSWCRTLVDDLHSLWIEQDQPGAVDTFDRGPVTRLLTAHLGDAVMGFDEAGPIPFAHDDGVAGATADLLSHLNGVIRERDAHAAATAAQLDAVQRDRDQILSERNDAVALRDRTIQSLQSSLDTPLNRMLRRLKQS